MHVYAVMVFYIGCHTVAFKCEKSTYQYSKGYMILWMGIIRSST